MLKIVLLVAIISIVVFIHTHIINNYDFINLSNYNNNYNIKSTRWYLEGNNEIFMYNPGIQWDKEGNITIISRFSGHNLIPRLKTCMNSHIPNINNEPIYIPKINEYLDIFGSYAVGSSGMATYNINLESLIPDKIGKIINPFLTKKNITNSSSKYADCGSQGFEDPRLFRYHNNIWIIVWFRGINFPFPSHVDTKKMGHHILIFPLDPNVKILPKLLYYDKAKKFEKNWMPFEYNDELYIVYQLNPHTILHVDMITGICSDVYSTNHSLMNNLQNIGNGAPPQIILLNNNKYYCGLAHIGGHHNGNLIRKNFLYIFEAEPPFTIIAMTPVFNICDTYIPIEFGSGLLIDNTNSIIYISYGVDDCYNSLTIIPIVLLIKLLEKYTF